MATSISPSQAAERVTFTRLLWIGPLTIIAAIVANVVVQQLAIAMLRPDPQFIPLTLGATIAFTLIGVLGAVIVFGLVGRFARRPIWLFQRIAWVTLLVSLIPDVLLGISGFMPGATTANVVVLMLMHIVAGVISIGMLSRLARAA